MGRQKKYSFKKKPLRYTQSRYLIFANANNNFSQKKWIKGLTNTDLILYYTGNDKKNHERYLSFATYVIKHNGEKFSNLKHFYLHNKLLFNCYKYIAVLDDDIIIDGHKINKIFEIQEKFKLWIAQPSQKEKSVHEIIHHRKDYLLHFTNFIEAVVPFFEMKKLKKFLKYYNEDIIKTYPLNWLFMQILGTKWKKKYAIIDAVQYIKPLVEKMTSIEMGEKEKKFIKNTKLKENYIKFYKTFILAKPLPKGLLLEPDITKINGINHIVWINLETSKDRYNKTKKKLDRFNVPNTRIKAIDGRKKNVRKLITTEIRDYYINNKKTKTSKVDPLKNTEIATTLSHLKAINYLNDLSGDYFMVCEDDISFENINLFPCDLKKIIDDCKDFDILMLQKTIIPEGAKKLKHIYTPWGKGVWGAVCYIITKEHVKRIVERVKYIDENFIFSTDKIFDVSDEYLYNDCRTAVYKYNFVTTSAPDSLIHSENLGIHEVSYEYQQQLLYTTYILSE